MRKILATLYVLFFVFALSQCAHAYQFENYVFGSNKAEVIEQLKAKKISYTANDEKDVIVYKDNLLNNSCVVVLAFTPKTDQLGLIDIVWEEGFVGNQVLDMLIKKYGQAIHKDKYSDSYVWQESGDSWGSIVLEYNRLKTTLSYSNKKMIELLKKEIQEMNEKDLNRI